MSGESNDGHTCVTGVVFRPIEMAVNARFWRANAVVPRIIDGVALGETPRRRYSGPCTQVHCASYDSEEGR